MWRGSNRSTKKCTPVSHVSYGNQRNKKGKQINWWNDFNYTECISENVFKAGRTL